MKLANYIDKFIGLFEEYTPKIIYALIVLIAGLWLINRISKLAQKSFERRNLDVSLRTFLKSLISIGLKIVLIVTVAGMVGFGTTSFVTILGTAGLAVGLALQGSLSNFAGGVLLLIFKPYRVGDVIEAQGQTGEVLEIQIFNTIVLTGEHKTVIFPNGALSNGTIINHTRHGNIRSEIIVNISTDNEIDTVKKVIRDVLDANDKILKKPAPVLTTAKVADGAVTIVIKPYSLPDDSGFVVTSVNEALKIAFEKHKVRPAIQSRVVHTINN